MDQYAITSVLRKLHMGISVEAERLSQALDRFLSIEEEHLIAFMNNQLFRGEHNLIAFAKQSMAEGLQLHTDIRKVVYEFVGEYISQFKSSLMDYLKGLFDTFYAIFKQEQASRVKEKALSPLREIILNYDAEQLAPDIINPSQIHKSLVIMLKQGKLTPTIKGEIWKLLSIIQYKFPSAIESGKKKQVQIISLKELFAHVQKDENISTIASILKAFSYSLHENYLEEKSLTDLYSHIVAIMKPVKQTYSASIAALELLQKQCGLFKTLIMKNAINLFKDLTNIMTNQNKEYKIAVLDTLSAVVEQMIHGISQDLENQNMLGLFNFIGNTMRDILDIQTGREDKASRYAGTVVSTVKILASMSPLILAINGHRDLNKFFLRLLNICGRKVVRAFENYENQTQSSSANHYQTMKLILYNQKQLTSFIHSFAKIIEHLETLEQTSALKLEQIFLIGIRQHPMFLIKYLPQLTSAMVSFMMSLSTKPTIFNKWIKKTMLKSLMESLDTKRFQINTDKDYYKMIEKSALMWKQFLTHQLWHGIVLKEFSKILFDCVEHLFLNLDVSYKSSLEMQMEEDSDVVRQEREELQLVNVFFLSDETIHMTNIADYQYISGLTLVFNEIMQSIDPLLYRERVFSFYEEIIYRVKIFPKSIPLMKVVRSLNTFIARSNWLEDESTDQRQVKELLSSMHNFFKTANDNIFKYQQNYFYQALKMLLSMPYQLFLYNDGEILKNYLKNILVKSLDLGQEIISLAKQALTCLSCIFRHTRQQGQKYLSQCIPYLEKYINFSKNIEGEIEQKEEVRSYLFLYESKIKRDSLSSKVMEFLGSIGGLSHLLVANRTNDYISWDYHCKLDLDVVMADQNYQINLTKLMGRTSWLMLNGSEKQKIVGCEFMHSVVVYVIGKAANKRIQSKQNMSNFFDKVLPTILQVASNTSHPSQQLIHTLLIQTIHFLANTYDPNSPDIQTLLQHLINMYKGAEDSSSLASKCLSQLIKWHIKQAPYNTVSFPLIKAVLKNIWQLVSNKKARNGLILFLIRYLKIIHHEKETKIMNTFAIDLGFLIITLGRTDKQIQPSLNYLIQKYIKALKPFIKNLIIEEQVRKYQKYPTLQKLLEWIYMNALFSLYSQQRKIAYKLWFQILTQYGDSFDSNVQGFLYERGSSSTKYLFPHTNVLTINEEEPKLDKVLPKINAFGEMWNKLVENNIIKGAAGFNDYHEVYLGSFSNFLEYLTTVFMPKPAKERLIPSQIQNHFIQCILIFLKNFTLLRSDGKAILNTLMKRVVIYQPDRNEKIITLIDVLFKMLFKPNSIIPNLNYTLVHEDQKNQSKEYYKRIVTFLITLLGGSFITQLKSYLMFEFKLENIQNVVICLFMESTLYDREIKIVLESLATIAELVNPEHDEFFENILKATLDFTVTEFSQRENKEQERQLSSDKRMLLLSYIFKNAEKFQLIQSFMIALIERNNIIYQRYEKHIMKTIASKWSILAQKVINLVKKDAEFCSTLLAFSKLLKHSQLEILYQLAERRLIGIGMSSNMMMSIEEKPNSSNCLGDILKFNYIMFEYYPNLSPISPSYIQYVHDLILEGMKVINSFELHEQSMNLAALLMEKTHHEHSDHAAHEVFIGKFRSALTQLTQYYIPITISRIASSQGKNKCTNFLKAFRSMIVVSQNFYLFEVLFSKLKDQDLEGFYVKLKREVIDDCLLQCFQKTHPDKQREFLNWLMGFYWDQNIDSDCWLNFRVIIVDEFLRKALSLISQEVLIEFFKLQGKRIYHQLEGDFKTHGVRELVLQLQIKRTAFSLLEELYSVLPKKDKHTEGIHGESLHKQIIKLSVPLLKSKFNHEALKILKSHDEKQAQQLKNQIILTSSEKTISKRPNCLDYLRNFYSSAYNCLIVVFISTQSNKKHFQSYLFESKNQMWENLLNFQKTDYNFEIQTSFQMMKPIEKINRKMKKLIKDKYWQNSLYVIEEEYVPASLVQSLPVVEESGEAAERAEETSLKTPNLQLDAINSHPCMINLLRVVDYLHISFYDGTQPGWMGPIYKELDREDCPLSLRLFLTKLIINRPNIFTQHVWASVLIKYLVLAENGGKFIHYFYRDAIKLLINFVEKGYKPQNIAQINTIIDKVVRALPHQNNMIYSDNIDILDNLLKVDGVHVSKKLMIQMLKSSQNEEKKKYEWRTCAAIVLKSCLIREVPILETNFIPRDVFGKYQFYFNFKKDNLLTFLLKITQQTVKKYRISASGFIGQLLLFLTEKCPNKVILEDLESIIVDFLVSINYSESNRNSKQRFSLCLYHVVLRYPQILEKSKLYNFVETSLVQFAKDERNQIIQSLIAYCQHLIRYNILGKIPHILMTIRGSVAKILSDSKEVQESFIFLIFQCAKSTILIDKQVAETYSYIYEELQRVYANSIIENCCVVYYRMLVSLRDFISDPQYPKTMEIRKLGDKVEQGLIKGLGSQHESVRSIVFDVFENPGRQYTHSSERLIEIFTQIYDPQCENLWVLNVVPLLFSLIKKSSDYTRLRFEESLADLTAFYDWDFRKNLKLQNSSQPYTPAFTLSTNVMNQNRRMGTLQQSMMPSVAGEKLRGMIRASQNAYMSQEEQVFTLLASQSESHFSGSLDSSQPQSLGEQEKSTQEQGVQQKINKIFQGKNRKRNIQMDEFKESNFNKYSSPVSIVNNHIRFNKNFDRNSEYQKKKKQSDQINPGKGTLIRKYKIGQLPDIQITTRDIVDPMIYLSNNDYQFASQLFINIFTKICMSSMREKKEKFKKIILNLLKSSKKYEFNFISTLQKSLICLCQNEQQSINFSMKQVAEKSNTYDYAVVFAEENQIQTLRHPDVQNEDQWRFRINEQWGDLIDFYHYLNQDQLIEGVLLKITDGEQKKLLVKSLQSKKKGGIDECHRTLDRVFKQTDNRRIKDFIKKERIDCQILLGQWEPVVVQMHKKVQQSPLTIEQQKILTIALQNTKNDMKESILKKVEYHESKCQYEKAISSLMLHQDIDKAKYHATTSLRSFAQQWRKISSFAFNSKHDLLQTIQKTFELQQFLSLSQKYEIKSAECFDLFNSWSVRQPSSIHDSNLTWIQLLESRMMYSKLISSKFGINETQVVKCTTDWLIQVTNGMVEKGVFGGAEQMIRRALEYKKKYPNFIWKFYDSIAKLKLKQFLLEKNTKFSDYEIVPRLIEREMAKQSNISDLEKIKFTFLQNQFFEGYVSSCLTQQGSNLEFNFVDKINSIYKNYEDMKKNLKQPKFKQKSLEIGEFRRQVYFKFTIFLQKMFSIMKGKFEIPQLKDSMKKRGYSPERLAIIFVQTLFMSIEISDFSSSSMISEIKQQTVFSLIMKLLKIIQSYPSDVGEYFSDAVSQRKIPIWIFLYFIPIIINYINNPNLAPHFQELFREIVNRYPEALIYSFNCTYESESDCSTALCREIYHELHKKMEVNYNFIDALELLQHPQIRLKEAIQKFFIVGQKDNAVKELKRMVSRNDTLGKYNRKFIEDWQSKIQRLLNKMHAKDSTVKNDIEAILNNLDFTKKQNQESVARMKDFNKISDASLFFEDYNSNDWNRIEVPGTSYRRFQEPKPWNKIYIQSFDHSILTLISKQRPKRITVYGSNEKKYMLLVKAGQDVRLDQRIEQLFDILNRIMKENSYCQKKQLKIYRYEVTPMKKMLGVFQWIDQSQTLKDFLEVEFKVIMDTNEVNLKQNNGAFQRRCKFLSKLLPTTKDRVLQHKPLQGADRTEVIKVFKQCEGHIPYGLLRKALERLSKNYDSYLHIKNNFISNYAVVCCVTYILGLGDRHLDNFLIHMASANIVPIDFGFSFGAGINIGIPELMPFRLTKTIVELLDPIGFDGIFRKSMENSLLAFSSRIPLITDYCEVFVDDPLMEWIWNNRKKNKEQGSIGASGEMSPESSQKMYFNKKIQHVYQKLKGVNPRLIMEDALANSKHSRERYFEVLKQAIWSRCKNKQKELEAIDIVDELISLATDKNILGRAYAGWNPYI